jgi:DNA-binding MarR family transcriptional regulator
MNSYQTDRGMVQSQASGVAMPRGCCYAVTGTVVPAGAEPARGQRVEGDTPEPRESTGLELAIVEAGFTRVWARWERAMEKIGGAVPAGQLRALLLIDDAGVLPAGRLAVALGLSASRTRSLCDLMENAGLLAYGVGLASDSGLGTTLEVTAAGQRLAAWIRNERRAVVADELETLSSAGRLALVSGLTELTASRAVPPHAGPPPERP